MSAAVKIDPTNPFFDKKLINTFIEGVLKTLETMAKTNAKPGKPFIETDFALKGEIAGMVGIVAPPLNGTLFISYGKDCIFQILENMFGDKHTEINGDVSDAVGELTNVIYGMSKTKLNQMGYNLTMAIPTVVMGDFSVDKAAIGATLVIPFNLSDGSSLYIEITVQ